MFPFETPNPISLKREMWTQRGCMEVVCIGQLVSCPLIWTRWPLMFFLFFMHLYMLAIEITNSTSLKRELWTQRGWMEVVGILQLVGFPMSWTSWPRCCLIANDLKEKACDSNQNECSHACSAYYACFACYAFVACYVCYATYACYAPHSLD